MKQPTMNGRALTLKQRKWLDLYIKTGNATEAALQAYDCKDRETAGNIGWENVKKLDYQELLEQAGLSDSNLLQTIREGLIANKTISARIVGKDADSQTDDFVEVPDHPTRHKFLETTLKLKKRLGPDTITNNQFNAEEMNIEFS